MSASPITSKTEFRFIHPKFRILRSSQGQEQDEDEEPTLDEEEFQRSQMSSGYDDNPLLPNPRSNNFFNQHLPEEQIEITTSQPPSPPTVVVRGEEIGIVIVVLLLWIGAIVLFFHRWGKIRMLEPYQPKFCESHRPSCPIADVPPISHFPRTVSKFNLSGGGNGDGSSPHFAKCTYNNSVYHGGYTGGGTSGGIVGPYPSTSTGLGPCLASISPTGRRPSVIPTTSTTALISTYYHPIPSHHCDTPYRPRQNSVFTPILGQGFNKSRKTRSAFDLSALVLTEEFTENVRRNSKNSITQV